MLIIKFSVRVGEMEARESMRKSSLSDLVDFLKVDSHHNVNGKIEGVLPLFNLLANTIALPSIPIGDEFKAGLTVGRVKVSVFGEGVCFSAFLTS